MEVGGLLHEDAHEIVSNQMDLEFLADHVGALAAQDIQSEDSFDLSKVKFYAASAQKSLPSVEAKSSTREVSPAAETKLSAVPKPNDSSDSVKPEPEFDKTNDETTEVDKKAAALAKKRLRKSRRRKRRQK